MRPVLVLSGTPRVVIAIARCLHKHGIPVDVLHSAASGDELVASRAIRSIHWLPDFTRPERFRGLLAQLLDEHGYDMLIPTTDESLMALSRFQYDLCQDLYAGCPAPHIINAVLDKRLTLEAARACGIDVPREYHFRSLQALESERDKLRFPLVAKPASKMDGLAGAPRFYQNLEPLRHAFLADSSFGHKFLLQEYCRGYGVGVEVLIWDGKVHALFQHRRLKELPSTGGVSVLAEAQSPDSRLVEASTRLLRQLDWQGVAMVEFRYDPASGRAVLMEVNGRYWGSLPLSVNAGIEFPYYEWQLAHGYAPEAVPAYRPGSLTLWRVGDLLRFGASIALWKSGNGNLSALCKEAWRVIVDCCSPIPDALWQWRDPGPGISEFRSRILKHFAPHGAFVTLLPAGLIGEIRVYKQSGLRQGVRHTYLKLAHAFGLRGRKRKSSLAECKSLLFVCSGNVIRSPLAAALLKRHLRGNSERRVASAGLFATPGSPADPDAIIAAREIGISLLDHRSRALSAELVEHSDVIFVMDHLNEAVFLNRFPRAACKVFLLGQRSEAPAGRRCVEIHDPSGRGLGEIRKCYGEIQDCVRALTAFMGIEAGVARSV